MGLCLLTQKGLIKKILETAKMEILQFMCKTQLKEHHWENCEDAEPFDGTEFNPRSIVGNVDAFVHQHQD